MSAAFLHRQVALPVLLAWWDRHLACHHRRKPVPLAGQAATCRAAAQQQHFPCNKTENCYHTTHIIVKKITIKRAGF
ncbi:MAG: hypothetical protein A2073_08635 [Deltaproteobacteria bacterium GWC2_42_11]|nr:MAG: hypothetical protein A2073_08635 [Deltaproteobacteria bacterium GWC2_42_11]